MNIEYSLATVDDITLMTDYRIALLNEVSGKQSDEKTATIRKKIESYFQYAVAEGSYICWIAKVNNEVAGISGMVVRERPASYRCPNGLEGYILNMYTAPAFRRQGIGKALLNKLMGTAKEMNLSVLALHATDEGEPLYKSHGFVEPKSKVMEKAM